MNDRHSPQSYQIRLKGHLSPMWKAEFVGFCIKLNDDGETLLCGTIIDQAALYGLLRRVRDLGLILIAVNPVPSDQTDRIA